MNQFKELGTFGKKSKKLGKTPSIALVNPKFPHNVGAAVRAASCFGAKQVWFTGDRVKFDNKNRLPREERMKGYKDVEIRQYDYFYDQFEDITPVAIELRPNSESLSSFKHPERALYVFGPEDGSLSGKHLEHCHRFVVIPTKHCVNLSAAVYLVLYDRLVKNNPDITIYDMLNERRSIFVDNDMFHTELGIE